MDTNTNKDIDLVISLLVPGGLFFTFLFFVMMNGRSVEKDYQISGRVNEVAFTEKGIPKIMIGGEIYFIKFPERSFVNMIQIGDSVVKEKNSKIYMLIKKNSNEVVLSDSYNISHFQNYLITKRQPSAASSIII